MRKEKDSKTKEAFVPKKFVSKIQKRTQDESFFDAFDRKYHDYSKKMVERFQEATGEIMDWENINLPNLDCLVQYFRYIELSDNSINQYCKKIMATLNLYRRLHPEIPSQDELSSVLNTSTDDSYDACPNEEEIDSLYNYLDKLNDMYIASSTTAESDKLYRKIQVLSHFLISVEFGARSFDEKTLSWNNIQDGYDSDGNLIYILTYTTNKRGKKASVPIARNARSVSLLKSIMPLSVCHRDCNRVIKRICKEAGLTRIIKRRRAGKDITEQLYKAIHFHVGRKTYCTHSLRRGASVTEVMMSMGHTNPKQTMKYNCDAPVFNASAISKQKTV